MTSAGLSSTEKYEENITTGAGGLGGSCDIRCGLGKFACLVSAVRVSGLIGCQAVNFALNGAHIHVSGDLT